jgi:uncharacterized repeat protein (TIGR01451 family)
MTKTRVPTSAWIAVVAFVICLPVVADVKVVLKASKIVASNGLEQRQPADKAKPGDIIEYVAEYRNAAKTSVSDVIATLPVPSGMEYIPDTAHPVQVMASTDEHNYAPVPLKRSIRKADGTAIEQQVPFSEYRSLRWNLGDIQGEKSKSVTVRMKVSTQEKSESRTRKKLKDFDQGYRRTSC